MRTVEHAAFQKVPSAAVVLSALSDPLEHMGQVGCRVMGMALIAQFIKVDLRSH